MTSMASAPAINGTASIVDTTILSDPNSIDITLTFDPDNPLNQTITLLNPAMVPVHITLADFTDLQTYITFQGISIGIQIGMTLFMLLTIALITSPIKRKTPIFACNIAALLFITLRNTFAALYFISPINSPYVYFMQTPWLVSMDQWRIAIAGLVFKTLFVICMQGSLVLQMKALLVTTGRSCRMVVLGVAYALATAGVVLIMMQLVVNATQIMSLERQEDHNLLLSIAYVLLAASMVFFCGVTTTILARALWSRKQMGLKQFNAMDIVAIMLLNTMIVPTTISVFGLITASAPMTSINSSLTAVFLPLSSLWAASYHHPSSDGRLVAAAPSVHGSGAIPQHGTVSGSTQRSTLMQVQLLLGERTLDHHGRRSKGTSGPSPLQSIFSNTSLHNGQTTGLGIYVSQDQTHAVELV